MKSHHRLHLHASHSPQPAALADVVAYATPHPGFRARILKLLQHLLPSNRGFADCAERRAFYAQRSCMRSSRVY